MRKIFDLDSPLMSALSTMADLLWLNLLTLILCIPIITAGAAITALHYSCLKLVRKEEGYLTKDYFKSFKLNFVQSTIIWLLVLVIGGILAFDYWYMIMSGLVENPNTIVVVGVFAAAVLYLLTLAYVFPVQSHFINPVKKTIRNAFFMSMMVLPKTILIILFWAIPIVVMYFFQPLFLLGILFWFSLPAYLTAVVNNKVFKRFEPEETEIVDDYDWSVGGDEEESGDSETDEKTEES